MGAAQAIARVREKETRIRDLEATVADLEIQREEHRKLALVVVMSADTACFPSASCARRMLRTTKA